MSWIWEICLSLNKHCFVIDLAGPISSYSRSRCGPRKFKSYNSSWQRPAQTIQIRADKNMSADFCYWVATRRDAIESMRVAWGVAFHDVWEEFWSEMQSSQASGIGGWASLLLQTKGHGRSYSNCNCLEEEVGLIDEWCLAHVSIASIACKFCWVLLASFSFVFHPCSQWLSDKLFG